MYSGSLVRQLAAIIFCFALLGCTHSSQLGSPQPTAPSTITLDYQSTNGVLWRALLATTREGVLNRIDVECNGEIYATVRENEFAVTVFGARAHISEGDCSRGEFQLEVFVIPEQLMVNVGGRYSVVSYYFKDGEFLNRSEVRDTPPDQRDIDVP